MSTTALGNSARVLVLAPKGRDSAVLAASMGEVGMETAECASMIDVCDRIDEGAGALLVTQEGLTPPAQGQLLQTLSRQPQWSAMPVVVLTMSGVGVESLAAFLAALGPVGAAILVERPIKPATLQSVLRMALLSRERQYQLRGYLDEISRQGVELAQHRDNLQALVERRTAELAVTMRKAQDAQRLAALGNMAAGIGHDIANMTLPIRARLEPLAASSESPEAKADIVAIGKSLDHLSNLSAGLRLMALDPSRDNASAIVNDLVVWADHADGVLRNALPRGVAFELRVDAPSGRPVGVAMASHRLTQAIFNLVQNAGEAIASTGAINGRVRIEVREMGDAERSSGRPQVEIVVGDNGPGIPREHINRIFEPYFTTKGRTIATGMGLGMVRGLIESVGGSVHVDSRPGEGATFTIALPAVRPASSSDRSRRRTAAVKLADPRRKAVAEAILSGLHVEIVPLPEGSPAPVPIDLWVMDPGAEPPSSNGDDRPRVCHVQSQGGLAVLRDALLSAVRDLPAAASAPESQHSR